MPGAEDALRLYRILLNPDAGDGNATAATISPTPAGKPDDAMATLVRENAELKRDNADYRKKNRTLKDDLATARESTNVPEDIAAELAEYRALGKPGDLKTKAEQAATLSREKALATIAGKAGVTKTEAFLKIAGDAEFEVKAEKKDGKDTESVFVKDGDKLVPFDDHFADFLPSIRPDAARPPLGGTPRRLANLPSDDATLPGRHPGGGDRARSQLVKSGRYNVT